MKRSLFLVATLTLSNFVFAGLEADLDDLRSCADQWETHPFGKIDKNTRFRSIETSVRVFGIGSETVDNKKTETPSLVLIRPSVSVMSKTTYKLLNPKGYYCFRGKVTVLGKAVIEADCQAKVASAGGATVIASKEGSEQQQGVTVLGSTKIIRVNCPKKEDED